MSFVKFNQQTFRFAAILSTLYVKPMSNQPFYIKNEKIVIFTHHQFPEINLMKLLGVNLTMLFVSLTIEM
jgi:hypothetical protein